MHFKPGKKNKILGNDSNDYLLTLNGRVIDNVTVK